MSTPRDVSGLLTWLDGAVPGTLLPAEQLAERIRELPAVAELDQDPPSEPEQLLTADAVAEWLGVDRQRVYRMARDGRLPSVRIGGNTVRFRRSDVERWLDRRRS